MEFEVLSPWGEVEAQKPRGLNPRFTNLDGKTVGLFAFFKFYGPAIMGGVQEVLQERFPKTKFSLFHHPGQDPTQAKFNGPFPEIDIEIMKDEKYRDQFLAWLKTVDTVVTGHSD
jgi:hypothetical protein